MSKVKVSNLIDTTVVQYRIYSSSYVYVTNENLGKSKA